MHKGLLWHLHSINIYKFFRLHFEENPVVLALKMLSKIVAEDKVRFEISFESSALFSLKNI